MDTLGVWWSAIHGWFLGSVQGAIVLAIVGNAAYAALWRIVVSFPRLGALLIERWGAHIGRETATASLTDPVAAVYWVGLRVLSTTLYALFTVGGAILFGPGLVRAGGVWWWVLTICLALGFYRILLGVMVIRINYELRNGFPGGRMKAIMWKALADFAEKRPGALADIQRWGVRIPGSPDSGPSKPPNHAAQHRSSGSES